MQLDQTTIAIRERGLMEILDLALHVIRSHATRLVPAFALGVAPFLLLNAWLMMMPDYYEPSTWYWGYTFWTLVLAALEMPLVGALMTLYLGQVMFMNKPDWKAMHRDFWRCLPQLMLFQGIIRGLLMLPVITSFLPYATWAYMTEIVLLERNPLRAEGDGISTWKRSKLLHGSNVGDIFLRWMGVGLVGAVQVLAVMMGLYFVKVWVTGIMGLEPLHYAIFLNVAIWSTTFYMVVVRFLCYLDLRIRREGWEVELRMRAEAVRMAGVLT